MFVQNFGDQVMRSRLNASYLPSCLHPLFIEHGVVDDCPAIRRVHDVDLAVRRLYRGRIRIRLLRFSGDVALERLALVAVFRKSCYARGAGTPRVASTMLRNDSSVTGMLHSHPEQMKSEFGAMRCEFHARICDCESEHRESPASRRCRTGRRHAICASAILPPPVHLVRYRPCRLAWSRSV